MIDIDTIKIGERIREKRLSLGLNQTAFLEKLKDVGVRDISHLSRIENGNITDKSLYVRICEKLDISTGDARLRIAFSQGFWAAPLVWINEYSATPDFFNHAALSAYTACEQSEMLIFNRKSERLPPFDAQKHDFFYSGEIADLLRDEKIDVGFLGSTVVDDKDFVRVARVVNANSVRHAMVVFTPKGKFKDANGKPDKRQIIEYLLQKPTTEAEACHVYYHPKSTAQNEYRELLQHADHWHNTLPVLDLPKFQKAFCR